jgi:sugar (pentulose or hexulose) kinase
MWILALDVGTSSIRAIGYDALGRPLPGADARVGCEPTTTPDGGAELDPEELVAATASAIDRCLAAASGPPAAVSASVFWHSLLALDADGRPLIGVITWADTRSAGAAKALRARLDARRHLIGGATSEGGNVLAWARRTLALPGEEAALDTALAAVTPDSHGLTALPFLAGERSPGWRGDARAARSVTPASGLRSWPTRWGCPSRCSQASRLRAAARRSWPWVRSAARLRHPSRRGLWCTPTPAVATSTPLRELARAACTTALWGPAYLERIGSRQETPDPCESRSAVTTPVFR